MTERKNTGGAAFPWNEMSGDNSNMIHYQHEGMTLRDYFAAQAMAGFLASRGKEIKAGPTAADAYYMADAMIEERRK